MDELVLSGFLAELDRLHRSCRVTDAAGTEFGLDQGARAAVDMLLAARHCGAEVILIGNGGSAAVTSHMQNDLAATDGMRALTFFDAPFLTATSNDFGYESCFTVPIRAWAKPGGVLVAVSSSGQSANILNGVAEARDRGMEVMTFSGFKADNPLRQSGKVNFYIESSDYGLVETAHGTLTHFISDAVKHHCRKAGA